MTLLVQPEGGESTVSGSNDGLQFAPSDAALSSGGYVTSWYDVGGEHVRAQLFDSAGIAIGEQITVDSGDGVGICAVTGLASGGFAVTWFTGGAVQAQMFSAEGVRVGDLIRVGAAGYYDSQGVPTITGLSSGGFTIAWGHGGNIDTAVYDASGEVQHSATIARGSDNEPVAADLLHGDYVVLWTDQSGANGDRDIGLRGQIFHADGEPVGASFQVNSTLRGAQYGASVASFADGSFVVTWTENGPNGSGVGGIRAQHFAADGEKIGDQIDVSSLTPNYQADSSVTTLPWGGFLVTWEDYSGGDGDFSTPSVRAQLFDSDGSRLGDEFRVNSQTDHLEEYPAVTITASNQAVFTWTDTGGGSESGLDGLLQRVFTLPTVGTAGDDRLTASGAGEALVGAAGNDKLNAGADGNILIGGSGDDLLRGGKGADTLDGGAGDDRLFGGRGADALSGGDGDDVFVFRSSRDVVAGEVYDGGDGYDTLSVKSLVVDLSSFALRNIESIDASGGIVGLTGDQISALSGLRGGVQLTTGGMIALDGLSVSDAFIRLAPVDTMFDLSGIARVDGPFMVYVKGDVGNDTIIGSREDDVLLGSSGNDVIMGGIGNDTLAGDTGVDTLNGGRGDDILQIRGFDDPVAGDVFIGGLGDDTLEIEVAGDEIDISAVKLISIEHIVVNGFSSSSTVSLTAHQLDGLTSIAERYRLTTGGDVSLDGVTNDSAGIYLSEKGNTIDASGLIGGNLGVIGNVGKDIVIGSAGADSLYGGAGDDILTGGAGIDRLAGDEGKDLFRFATGDTGATARSADTIADFRHSDGDVIDLSAIDAAVQTSDTDAFHFIGKAAFSGTAGELRFEFGHGNTLLMGDTDGDAIADVVIRLTGKVALAASDFLFTADSAFVSDTSPLAAHSASVVEAIGLHAWESAGILGDSALLV